MRSLLAAALLACTLAAPARAADHADGTAVKTAVDPSADITDLFAWTSPDGKTVYLVLNVFPSASGTSKFSPQVQYAFHVSSTPAYGQPATGSTDIICTFSSDAAQKASCWLGGADYASGDASITTGLTSQRGHFKVFAGPRDDPFFFNLVGFKAFAKYVHDNTGGRGKQLDSYADASGCPQPPPSLMAPQSMQTALTSDGQGGAAADFFAGKNVLSIAIAVDAAQLQKTSNGVLAVWASTHKAP
jgi:hypothetical protein